MLDLMERERMARMHKKSVEEPGFTRDDLLLALCGGGLVVRVKPVPRGGGVSCKLNIDAGGWHEKHILICHLLAEMHAEGLVFVPTKSKGVVFVTREGRFLARKIRSVRNVR